MRSVVIVRWRRSGRVLPYDDEETGTIRKKKKKPKRRVIQTQTETISPPVRQRPQQPRGTLLAEPSHPPAVLVTDATPASSPGPLPGTVDEYDAWASPYPEPIPSVSEPTTSRKTVERVTVERVSVIGTNTTHRPITPSSVDVTSISQETRAKPKKDLSAMLPDVNDGSRNVRPG